MEQIVYVLHGDPIPLARPRLSGQKKMWDSQKQRKFVSGLQLSTQHKQNPLYNYPISLSIIFYMKIPATNPKKKILDGRPHIFTPDLDNLIKWVCDIGNGVLWNDDCIIATISAQKLYDKDPRTEFTVMKL